MTHAIIQKEKFTSKHQILANVTTGQEDRQMEFVDQIDVPKTNVSLKVEDHMNRMLTKVNAFHAVLEKNQLLIVEDAIYKSLFADQTKYHIQLGLEMDWVQDAKNQTANFHKGIQIHNLWQEMVFVKTAQINEVIDSILLDRDKETDVTHVTDQEFSIVF